MSIYNDKSAFIRLTKKYTITLLLIISISLLLLYLFVQNRASNNTITGQFINSFGETYTLTLEVADSESERQYGLMNRKSLDSDKGMLFIFPNEEKRSFWMKNTYIPLDIIYINSKKEVVSISENAEPCINSNYCPSYLSNGNAQYVIEVNGGWSKTHKIQPGDKVNF